MTKTFLWCIIATPEKGAMSKHSHTQKPPKRVFLAAVVMIFFCTVSAAESVGFVPYYIDGSEPATASEVELSDLPQLGDTLYKAAAESPATPQGILPERIKSPVIGLDVALQNPSTRDLATLNAAILKSPARYVDSAKLGVAGNMLIFAHSSTYPVVKNPMWKAFNRIHELKKGDSISILGGGIEYLYMVTSVRSADASETVIDLSPTQGTKLTLTTCDILTGKSARFIVEAEFVGIVKPN